MPLKAWLLAALAALPVHKEDRGNPDKAAQLERLADAVAAEAQSSPVSPREWSALLLTIGWHESGLSLRIANGQCRPRECDRGRARGMFQIHRNTLNRNSWAKQDGDIELQAHLASEQLKRAYWTCKRSGVNWLTGTINAYAGRRCSDDSWPGLKARVATYRSLQ